MSPPPTFRPILALIVSGTTRYTHTADPAAQPCS